MKKLVKVAAGVICDSIKEKRKIFATCKGYGKFKGKWEFPGGKVEEGETFEQALVREIREELDTSIYVGDLIDIVEYEYPDFNLYMECFWCEVIEGELKLLEAQSACWLGKEELYVLDWLSADIGLLKKIEEQMK